MGFQVIPILILWFLWKRRNTILHGCSYSIGKIIWEAVETTKKFMQIRFKVSYNRRSQPEIVENLEKYKPTYKFRIFRWTHPPINWLKCNTDGATKGNPKPSSAAFCIRNSNGDLIIAKGLRIQDTINLVAEARAIREGLEFAGLTTSTKLSLNLIQ